MKIERVLTLFSQTPEGERHLQLADRLAAQMGVGSLLAVDVDPGPRESMVKARLGQRHGLRVVHGAVEILPLKAPTLFVSNTLPARNDLFVLQPFYEREIDLSGDRCMLVPFGSRESGVFAALHALPIARQMKLNVVFYHTTWRDPRVKITDPRTHMDEGARTVLRQIVELANQNGVGHRVVIETADDVLDGIITAAIRERASVIAAARGLEVERGSYAERLQIGPVPLLTIGRGVKEVMS